MDNKTFKEAYDEIFGQDPLAANVFLMLVDIADENGKIYFEGTQDEVNEQIMILVAGRFNDVEAYQLGVK